VFLTDAAEDDDLAQTKLFAVSADLIGDLTGEFAGRRQDQGPRPTLGPQPTLGPPTTLIPLTTLVSR